MDGFECCERCGAAGERMPVIMLTARSATSDAVDGLDAGASDYVPKPFSVAELMARVRSRLRERTGAIDMVLTQGDVSLDILARRTTVAGREIDLSAREFALAEQFLRHPGTVLAPRVLLSRALGHGLRPGVERRRRVRPVSAFRARRRAHRERTTRRGLPLGSAHFAPPVMERGNSNASLPRSLSEGAQASKSNALN